MTPDEGIEVLKDEKDDDQNFYVVTNDDGSTDFPSDVQFYWDVNWFVSSLEQGDSGFSEVLSEVSGLNLTDADISTQLSRQIVGELGSNPTIKVDFSALEAEIANTLSGQEDLETSFGQLQSLTKDDLNGQTRIVDIKQSLLEGKEGKASTYLRVALYAAASGFETDAITELTTVSDSGNADQLVYDLYTDLQTSKLAEISAAVGELPDGIEYSPEQLVRIQEVGQKVAASPGAVEDLKQATQVLSTKQHISTVIDNLITEYQSIDLAFDKYIADNSGDADFDIESVENYKIT